MRVQSRNFDQRITVIRVYAWYGVTCYYDTRIFILSWTIMICPTDRIAR